MTSTLTKTVKESKQEASYPTTMQTHNFALLFTYKHNRTSKESNYYKMWIYVKYTLCYGKCNCYTWNADEQESLIKIGMYESKRTKTIILI